MKNMKSKIVALVLTFAMVLSLIAVPVSAETASADVKPATADDALKFLSDKKMLQGDENGDLMADKNLTREQMIVILSRLAGAEEEAQAYDTASLPFSDVPQDSDYAPYIAWAYDNEITQGMDETTFGFGQSLTAEQTKIFLVRSLGYTDVADEDMMAKADELKITVGSTVEDKTPISRANMALLFANTLFGTTKDGKVKGEEIGVVIVKEAVAPVLADVKAADTTTASATTKVTGKVTPATATVKVAGAAVTVAADGTFSADAALVNGENKIAVVATNDGKTDTKEVVVTKLDKVVATAVTAINAKQLKVEFSGPVDKDSAETAANYAGTTLQATDAAVLQADKKTVILNSNAALTLYTEMSVTVSNVKDLVGNTVESKNFKLTPADTSIPTLVSARSLGNKAIELTFSEPVQNSDFLTNPGSNFKLDDNVLYAAGATATVSTDKTKVTLSLVSALVPGDHKIAVFADGTSDITDYANYVVPADVKTINVVTATQAVTVASVVANSQTQATVTFSDAVNKLVNVTYDNDGNYTDPGEDQLANFYWNTSGTDSDNSKIADSIKKIDDKTYEVKFTGTNKAMTAGKVYFFVKNVEDFYGNKIAGNSQTANVTKTEITITANAAPSVASVTAKEDDEVVVKYATDMTEADVESTGNYTIKDKDAKVITVNTATYDSAKKEVTLATATMTAGTYTIEVSNVKDVIGTTMTKFSGTITPTDTTAPTVSSISVSSDKKVIAVTFNEAMATTGDHSILNSANYQFKDVAGENVMKELPAGVTLSATADNKTVRLTFPTAVVDSGADLLNIGYIKGAVSYNVADVAGNLITAQLNQAIGGGAAAIDISGADVSKVSVATATTVKVILTAKVWGDVVASDFQVTKNNGTDWKSVVSAVVDADDTTKKTIILTVADADKFTASDMTQVKVQTLAGQRSTTDNYGVKIADTKVSAAASENKIAASVVGAVVVDATHVNVLFDAPIKAAGVADFANTMIVVQGTSIQTGTKLAPIVNANSDKVVELTLTDAIALDQSVTVKTVSKDLVTAVDKNNNLVNANTTGFEAATGVIAKTLTVSASPVDQNSTIDVVFNRNIDTKSIKSDWDGTGDLTGLTVTFRTDGTAVVNGAAFGTIENLTVTAQETLAAKLSYVAGTRTLTLTITGDSALNNITYLPASDVQYAPDASIKSTNGTAVTTTYKPVQ